MPVRATSAGWSKRQMFKPAWQIVVVGGGVDDHDCGCGGSPGACECDSAAERAAGRVTPAGQPCLLGRARLPNGRCPEDTDDPPERIGESDIAAAQWPTRARWEAMSAEEQTTFARQWATARGASEADARAFAERSRAADYALVAGIVTGGFQTVQNWIHERNETERTQIEWAARERIARIQAESRGQGSLLDQPPAPTPATPAASSGTSDALLFLPLLFLLARGGL